MRRSWQLACGHVTFWHAIRFLHLRAMAFFIGGQLVLVAAVVPTVGRGRNPEAMRGIALAH